MTIPVDLEESTQLQFLHVKRTNVALHRKAQDTLLWYVVAVQNGCTPPRAPDPLRPIRKRSG